MKQRVLMAMTFATALISQAQPATFLRGINLNGPALKIEGHDWESGKGARNLTVTGKTFENQRVLLKPPVDAERTRMIRSSVWGNDVNVTFSAVPEGSYQIYLYVWEDNNNERFSLKVNDKVVVEAFESGSEGMWKKLGPWSAQPVAGKIKITATAASHGAANLSGIELWQGSGDIPQLAKAGFAESPRADQIAFFENKIRPVLVEHCYECHSATAKKIKGGLVLDSRAGVHKGGDTGPLLTPGDPAASLLIEAVNHLSEDTAMPPKQKLPANVIADLETWVRMGAPDPRNTEARKATPEKPLLLICGGPLTTAANALLLAPDIASRIIVFNILVTHYGYNGKDGWAAYIVAKQTRYVDWGGRGRGFWDRNSNLPN